MTEANANRHRVLIAVPSDGRGVHPRTVAWLLTQARAGIDVAVIVGRPHDYTRNSIMRAWRDRRHYTHLLQVDDDVEPPIDAVQRLLAVDRPIVTGLVPIATRRGLRYACGSNRPDGGRILLSPRDLPVEPCEVEACGAALLLLRRDVLDVVEWPWFRWTERADGYQQSEDYFFADRARAAGLSIWAAPAVIGRHHKSLDLQSLIETSLHSEQRDP